MNEIIVYHGGTDIVKHPMCQFGRPNNQMCLLNQEVTDKYLIFNGTETI